MFANQRAPLEAERVVAPKRRPGRRSRAPERRAAPAVRRLETTVEGLRIHAIERPARPRRNGAPAPTVILIHGAGLDHADWSFDFLARLEPHRRILAFDRPGFGRSERPSGPGAALPSAQARLLRKAAAQFGVEKAVIVGHSWGGAVAMAWGLAAPETVHGVVSLAGAVAPWSFARTLVNGARMRERALTAMRAGGRAHALRETFETAFAPARAPTGYIEHVQPSASDSVVAATLSDLSTINGALALMTPRYRMFDRPVELIYGDADEILCPIEQGVAAHKMLPSARLSILKGRGHMIHHSDPNVCLDAIDRILAASLR